MNLNIVIFAAAVPLFALQAQTQPDDCDHRTAQDYVATTRTERLAEYIRHIAGPQAILYAGALAAVDQATDRPREWGQGSEGYGRRIAAIYGRDVVVATLQDGSALALDEDNRYFRSGEAGFARRLEYSLTSPFLARRSDGSRTLSYSALGGVAGGSLIQQIWQPPSTEHPGNAARTFSLTFAFRAGLDVVREFAPRKLGAFVR